MIVDIINSSIMNMSNTNRYMWMSCNHAEILAEHNNYVIMITDLLLTKIEENYSKLWKKFNIDKYKVLSYAIYHDYEEIYTWDIPTPVKNASKEFLHELNKIWEKLMKEWLKNDFSRNNQIIMDHILETHLYYEENKYKTLETQIVKFADMIQAYFYSFNEVESWNKRFINILKWIVESIKEKFWNKEDFIIFVNELIEFHENNFNSKINKI